MPMRWTPENDQLLLVTILETHEFALDFNKIANAWRARDETEKPTPRAIKERLFRIRSIIKSAGAGAVLNMSGTSPTATPKSARTAASTPKTPVSSKRKRAPTGAMPKKKKKDDGDEGSESEVLDIDTPSKKPSNTTAVAVGATLKTEDGVVVKEDLPKRVSKPVVYPDMMQQSSEEGDGREKKYGFTDSSGSKFVLEDFVNMGRVADMADLTAVKTEEV